MRRRAIAELNAILARTASLSGRLRQFEMRSSKAFEPEGEFAEFQRLQEHVESLYGMVQRVCAILLEDS